MQYFSAFLFQLSSCYRLFRYCAIDQLLQLRRRFRNEGVIGHNAYGAGFSACHLYLGLLSFRAMAEFHSINHYRFRYYVDRYDVVQ